MLQVMRDRRFDYRRPAAENVDLDWSEAAGAPQRSTGTLLDLSVSGLRVLLEHPIRLHTKVELRVGTRQLRGIVRYCTQEQARYMLGIELDAK
jgi:hypothetical protein